MGVRARRYVDRYKEEGLDGLIDQPLGQVSHLRAPVDEVLALKVLYKKSVMSAGASSAFHDWDLIAALIDTTCEICSDFFVLKEGAWSGFAEGFSQVA